MADFRLKRKRGARKKPAAGKGLPEYAPRPKGPVTLPHHLPRAPRLTSIFRAMVPRRK
jgi:hypothetical protein